MFAWKNGGTLVFCVYYKKLNAVTQRDSYSMPRVDECINFAGESTICSTLGGNNGYWHVETDDTDNDKTALIFYHGIYRIIEITFILKSAPETFQKSLMWYWPRWNGCQLWYVLTVLRFSPRETHWSRERCSHVTAKCGSNLKGSEMPVFHRHDRLI